MSNNYDPDFNPFYTTQWPRAIHNPDDYTGEERLCLSWDLGAVPEKEKKKVIQQWSKKLPELQGVRWLNVWSQVTPPIFEALCQMPNLHCLQIKWSNLKDIGPIRNLTKLNYLYFGSSTRVESIEPLAALTNLRNLHMENFKLINDFSPLTALVNLDTLDVTGSMWGKQGIASLEPFAQMTWLKSLGIDTSSVESLRPLAKLKGLKTLGMGGRLPLEEYAWLSAMLPNTECPWFSPYLDLTNTGISNCPKCKQQTRVMLTGKGAGMVCRSCDSKKFDKHLALFESLKAQARP